MQITKTFQDHKKDGTPCDKMDITVNYDPESQAIVGRPQIKIWDTRTGIGQDVSSLFLGDTSGLKNYFENIIDDIDWREEYRNLKQEQRRAYGKLPNINTAFQNIINDHSSRKTVGDNYLSDVVGQWPGDETIEETLNEIK